MTKFIFIRTIFIFLLPVILLGCTMEVLLRRIPNDYAYKRNYLGANSKKIEVLILGSSHGYYDVNPVYLHANGFNAGYVSQSLNYDYEIFKKYQGEWDHLEYIVLPISYFSLYSRLDLANDSWRVKNYEIYYGMTTSNDISDYFEILSNNADINFERLKAYYRLNQTNVSSSILGWGNNFNSKNRQDLIESGVASAKRHVEISDETNLNENINVLNTLIKDANENDITIIFFTPPAYSTYVENLNKEQLNQVILLMTQLDEKYQNVIYINYLTDPSFTEDDFYDADHLNEIGAEKLTMKIDDLIIIR